MLQGAAQSYFRLGCACATWLSIGWQFCVYGEGRLQTGMFRTVLDYLIQDLQRKVHFLSFYLWDVGNMPMKYLSDYQQILAY